MVTSLLGSYRYLQQSLWLVRLLRDYNGDLLAPSIRFMLLRNDDDKVGIRKSKLDLDEAISFSQRNC